MANKFEPILNDLPIEFAFEHKDVFVNKARTKEFGGDTFFFPPNYSLDQYGCGGYYYTYGYPYSAKRGKKSNCTYVAGAFHLLRSGQLETCVITDAVNIFGKYKGRKDGGKLDNTYIGDTIQPGDWLIFADNKDMSGAGHIITVEQIKGDTITVMEGAWSDKSIYEGKACIVYNISKSDMFTGKRIMLRPSVPFYEYLLGVCHTGDVYAKEEPDDKMARINKLAKEIVELSK